MVYICSNWKYIRIPNYDGIVQKYCTKAKYSHYSRSSHKSVYVDNVDDYVSHNEVQIGKFVDNEKK